jgi:hypothetical protein
MTMKRPTILKALAVLGMFLMAGIVALQVPASAARSCSDVQARFDQKIATEQASNHSATLKAKRVAVLQRQEAQQLKNCTTTTTTAVAPTTTQGTTPTSVVNPFPTRTPVASAQTTQPNFTG